MNDCVQPTPTPNNESNNSAISAVSSNLATPAPTATAEPEDFGALSEDEPLMPENEPEKNLKIRAHAAAKSVEGRKRAWLKKRSSPSSR